MDAKDQIIHNLNKEIELLKIENQYLKDQLLRLNQGKPIEFLDYITTPNGKHKSLPPLNAAREEAQTAEIPINKIITEYQFEIHRLMNENQELRATQEMVERNYGGLIADNTKIQNKLQNLEQVFLSDMNKGNGGKPEEYMTANLMNENSQLKIRVKTLVEKRQRMEDALENRSNEKLFWGFCDKN